MTVYVEETTIEGACGVSVLYEFYDIRNSWGYPKKELAPFVPKAGCGIVGAGFIVGDEICDEAFAKMSELGELMYKTPVRKNRNSGNKFYFALFDMAKGGRAKYGFDDAENAE